MRTDVKIHRTESQDDGMKMTLKEILLKEDTSEEDSITDDRIDIPMGCLLECARPDSPTAVTDFPVCKNNHTCVQLTPQLTIHVWTTSKLPTITRIMAPMEQLVEDILQTEDRCETEPQIPPAQVMEPSMAAIWVHLDIPLCVHMPCQPQTVRWTTQGPIVV